MHGARFRLSIVITMQKISLYDYHLLLGTLTQNEMVFRRLHLGTVAYGMDSMDEVQSHVFSAYTPVGSTHVPI